MDNKKIEIADMAVSLSLGERVLLDKAELETEYEIKGNIEKRLGSIYPMKAVIKIPIRYRTEEYDEIENIMLDSDLSSNRAVSLTLEVKYPNYPKEKVKNAIKIACLKFLEEFC